MQTITPVRADTSRVYVPTPQTFLTGPQVQERYQRSHVSIWRWVKDEALGFPQPIKINGLNYWRLSDLEAWEAGQAVNA